MLYTLENDKLCVLVRSYGAELRSIKERADETEYLWDGNPSWWKYSSPVLFPIVGKLLNGKYRVDGQEYELPGHGLGRISDFELVERQADRIRFSLKWTQESLKKYPWKFQLDIEYVLHDNQIEVIWTVQNLDDKEMIYSIGSHGAFRCPSCRERSSRTAIWPSVRTRMRAICSWTPKASSSTAMARRNSAAGNWP